MMDYVDTKYLGKCETCRHHRSGSCNTFCDCGEEYSPDLSKIPTADVVPKSEVENLEKEVNRLKHILDCYALQYGTVTDKQKVIDEVKQEVAREIFEKIETLLALNVLVGDVFTGKYFDADLENDIAELEKKYTGEQE